MARNRQPVLKKCRNLGLEPSILGVNKKSNRNIRPNANRKLTEYGTQLREKQKARFVYGVQEKQFYKLYEEATRKDGVTGELLLQYLERRLDNVIYRLGFGTTRRQARQIVSHGHILINGKRVNIASYRVKQGDVLSIKENSKELSIIKESVGQKTVPGWLSLEEGTLTAKVLENPGRDAIDFEINEAMIIEFYSR
ncbi:MAG: 30S ribosomal protein S4 [Leptotrichiaceae bacterium]|nr:30S ribosomal protein S4 [Leptotrichiaceae bacterium]MBP6280633.1 30S ribosomal protein S4 [Leptotrichiaceae bacterium]MBP7100100.1 30S ribosomal protein S4 [Leptotrichiaceae bacterium]MBP7725132.1 30S ribosomal protein S4 [Leptotrichiaceae bacterium]MBP9629185.1 30S ribosomal protein S4 [Leptotrichiaceae bacterium]